MRVVHTEGMRLPKEKQDAHSHGGSTSSYGRRIIDARRQDLEVDFLIMMINQG
jgi:hypothetical protein